MATVANARNIMLQTDTPRTLPVQLPSNYTSTGDHSGTLDGSPQTNFQNSQIQLSNTGQLLNAGGGGLDTLDDVGGNFLGFWESVPRLNHRNDVLTLTSDGTLSDNGTPRGNITDLDYGNVSGSKPPSNATSNFFSTSGSNPSGGSDGDAHWNSSTSTMWFKTGGVWRVGGTVNANEIITGTLAAARIASNSITTDKLNVSTLSGISTNIGTVTNGTISSSAAIDINGIARFNGNAGGFAILANNNETGTGGVSSKSGSGTLPAIRAENISGAGSSLDAISNSSGTKAARIINNTGGTALEVQGPITITAQTISNLTAGSANNVAGSNVSGTVASATNASNATNSSNTSAMDGVDGSNWCRIMVTDSGSAAASSSGFVFTSTVTGVRVRATGGRNFVVEEFSDEELKINENPEKLGIDFILGLEPVTYERQDNPGITYHGIGARKTRSHLEKLKKQKSNDTLGRTLDDGTESSSTIGLIAPLIMAMKELHGKVQQLEETINQMEV
jgi:hypothetical protein